LIDGIVKSLRGNEKGQSSRSAALLGRALAIKEKALGLITPMSGNLSTTGQPLQQPWPLRRRRALYNRSLTITEKARGPDHPNVAAIFNAWARTTRHRGRYADAEALFKRSLAIREKALGPDDSDVGNSSTAWPPCTRTRRYADAEPLTSDL